MVQDINTASSHQNFLLQRIRELAGTRQGQTPQRHHYGVDKVDLNAGRTSKITYDASLGVQEFSRQVDRLREMALNTLREQGVATRISMSEREIDLGRITPEEAQSLIGEDGYFGVAQTSERIFQFAAGLIEAFPEHKDAVLQGFEKGFAEAEAAFGGQLPEICYQTRDAFLSKMGEFLEKLA